MFAVTPCALTLLSMIRQHDSIMTKARDDAGIIAGLLDGRGEAVATVDTWILRAARPYQRRLQHQWDDVLQDLRLEVLRLLRGGRFEGRSSLKTYLWRVVGHSCLDRIRALQRWRWVDFEDAEAHSSGNSEGGTSDGGTSGAGTFEVGLGGRLDHLPAWSPRRDLLLRVLERMPAACRRLWRMIAAGLSYREMSVKVGSAEGALRVRVLRCRQQATQVRQELEAPRNVEPVSNASTSDAPSSGRPAGGGRVGKARPTAASPGSEGGKDA